MTQSNTDYRTSCEVTFNLYEALFVISRYWRDYVYSKADGANTEFVLMNLEPGELFFRVHPDETTRFITSDPIYWHEWCMLVACGENLIEARDMKLSNIIEFPYAEFESISIDAFDVYRYMTLFLKDRMIRFKFDDIWKFLHKLELNLVGVTTVPKYWSSWLECIDFVDRNQRRSMPKP